MELPWVDHTDVLARIGRERPMTLQLAQPDQGERRMALEASSTSASPSTTGRT